MGKCVEGTGLIIGRFSPEDSSLDRGAGEH